MKNKRLIAALLAFVIAVGAVGLLPTPAYADTTTGTGIAPITDNYYWTPRVTSGGKVYIYMPPVADGRVMYCLDYGYAYAASKSSFLQSYTYVSATGSDADALWEKAIAKTGLSEMDADIQENVKWLMSYVADSDAGGAIGAFLMSVQTYMM